jgi:hypothetical protein
LYGHVGGDENEEDEREEVEGLKSKGKLGEI